MNKFSEYDNQLDKELDYKPVYKQAILALVLSLVCVLTLAFPGLIFLNVAVIGLAIFSISKISASEQFVGLKVAQMALFIAVGTAAFSLSHNLGRTLYLNRVARVHSLIIAKLMMEGRYPEAYEYTVTPGRRQPQGTDLNQYYAIPKDSRKPPPSLELFVWLDQPPIEIIEMDRRQGTMTMLGYGSYQQIDPFSDPVTVIYQYEPKSPDLETSTFHMIFLRRPMEDVKGAIWRLLMFEILAGPEIEKREISIGGPPQDDEPDDETDGESSQ